MKITFSSSENTDTTDSIHIIDSTLAGGSFNHATAGEIVEFISSSKCKSITFVNLEGFDGNQIFLETLAQHVTEHLRTLEICCCTLNQQHITLLQTILLRTRLHKFEMLDCDIVCNFEPFIDAIIRCESIVDISFDGTPIEVENITKLIDSLDRRSKVSSMRLSDCSWFEEIISLVDYHLMMLRINSNMSSCIKNLYIKRCSCGERCNEECVCSNILK